MSATRQTQPRVGAALVRPAATVALILLGAGAIGVAAWSLVHGGIGWDSREHTQAALAVRSVDTSWPIAKAYAAVPGPLEFYGVLIQQLADVLHFVFSGSTARLQPDDPDTYLYQGIANLIVAVVAVTALAAALAIALRSALAGAFAWSLILATPLWLGISHVNFKDVPVAAGLSLVTAGLLLSSSVRSRGRATAAGILLAGPGGAIVLSTRPGAIVPLVALTLGAVAGIWVIGRRGRVRMLPTLLTAGVALAGGIAFTWATNPFPRIAMLPWLKDSINVSRSFPWDHPIRTAGQRPAKRRSPVVVRTGVARRPATAPDARGRCRRRCSSGRLPRGAPPRARSRHLDRARSDHAPGRRHSGRDRAQRGRALRRHPATPLRSARAARDSRRRAGRARAATGASVARARRAATRGCRRRGGEPVLLDPLGTVRVRVPQPDRSEQQGGLVGARLLGRQRQGGGRAPREARVRPGLRRADRQRRHPLGAAAGPPHPGPNAGLYVFLRWNRAADFGCTVIFTIKRGGHVLGEGARCPPAS